MQILREYTYTRTVHAVVFSAVHDVTDAVRGSTTIRILSIVRYYLIDDVHTVRFLIVWLVVTHLRLHRSAAMCMFNVRTHSSLASWLVIAQDVSGW